MIQLLHPLNDFHRAWPVFDAVKYSNGTVITAEMLRRQIYSGTIIPLRTFELILCSIYSNSLWTRL